MQKIASSAVYLSHDALTVDRHRASIQKQIRHGQHGKFFEAQFQSAQ